MAALFVHGRCERVHPGRDVGPARARRGALRRPRSRRSVGAARARRGLGGRRERARRPATAGRRCSTSPLACSRSPGLARASCWSAAPTRTRRSPTSTARCPRSTAPPACVHDPELTRVLLEADANPDDGESRLPRHRGARAPTACARCSSTARRAEPIMLAHALDDERPEHVRLLLDDGADADRAAPARRPPRPRPGDDPRCWSSRRGARAPRRGRRGAGPSALRTAYQHAVLRNRDDVRRAAGGARREAPTVDVRRPRGGGDRARRAPAGRPRDARLRPAGGR